MKRILSIFLAILMCVSLLPIGTLASESPEITEAEVEDASEEPKEPIKVTPEEPTETKEGEPYKDASNLNETADAEELDTIEKNATGVLNGDTTSFQLNAFDEVGESPETSLEIALITEMEFDISLNGAGNNIYTIGYNVPISVDTYATSSNKANCWEFAKAIYKGVWNGETFSSNRGSNDDMLRGVSYADHYLSAEHLKEYISAAPVGACIRICTDSNYNIHDGDAQGTIERPGHSQIIVNKDVNGFTVFESNVKGTNGEKVHREKYYTWDEYIASWGDPYYLIKYIKFPNAPAYRPDTEAPIVSLATVSNISENGFDLSFTAVDSESGIQSAYVTIWEQGKSESDGSVLIWKSGNSVCTGTGYAATFEDDTATFSIRVDQLTNDNTVRNFYLKWGASDGADNEAGIAVCSQYGYYKFISLYDVEVKEALSYRVIEDNAAVRNAPYAKINGENTKVRTLAKGDIVSVIGVYENGHNNKWYQIGDNEWIYSGNVKARSLYNAYKSFVSLFTNKKITMICDQPVEHNVTTYSTTRQLLASGINIEDGSYAIVSGAPYSYTYSVSDDGTTTTRTEKTYSYCTVSFDANGGTTSTSTKRVVTGSTYGAMPTPARFGYRFDGWFTEKTGGTQITSGTSCSITGSQTLYAHWTRIILSQGSCGDNLNYILYGDGELTITGSGRMDSCPWIYEDYAGYVLDVHLPNGLENICDGAFSGCAYLESISLPESVTEIGWYAFENTGLTSLTLPKGLTILGHRVLADTKGVTVLSIPKTVVDAWSALEGSYVQSLTFESGITKIPGSVASGAEHLTQVTIPNSATKIEDYAFSSCTSLTGISIPDSVTEIGWSVFSNTGLTSLALPKYLTDLGYYVLTDTKGVTVLTIPKTVTNAYRALDGSYVQDLAFESGCTEIPGGIALDAQRLIKVTIPESVTKIKDNAFNSCISLVEINIPNRVTEICDGAFAECSSLKSIGLPDSVTEIGRYAFANTGLTSLILPKYVTYLGWDILNGTEGVTTLTIPKTVTDAGSALEQSYVQDLTFESGCAEIPEGIANGAQHLTKVIIPESVIKIGNSAFRCCSSLVDIKIPSRVTEIGDSAFAECTALEGINLPDGVTAIGGSAFSSCISLVSIYLPDGLRNIGNWTFSNCTALPKISIPNSVTEGGWGMFSGCTSLNDVKLSGGCNYIPDNMFRGCTALEKIVIPDSVNEIWYEAFKDCTSLKEITWGTGLQVIGYSAFENTGFTNISVSDSVTRIDYDAFRDCDLLENASLPNSVIEMGTGIFLDCDALKTASLGTGITEIPYSMFEHCDALESVIVPCRVTKIGDSAFKNCTKLTSITIPPSVTEIPISAFSYYDKHTIYGVTGSYAETYANEHAIKFVPREVKANKVAFRESALKLDGWMWDQYLEFSIDPADCTEELVWSSSNEDVATVENGYLNTRENGIAEITLRIGNASAVCTVTVGEPHEHSYVSEVTTPATCDYDGVLTYRCTGCGDNYTETIPATGHDWGMWTVSRQADCENAGEETRVCKNDSSHTETRSVPALGHDLTHVAAKPATTTAEGNIEYWHCERCGKYFSDSNGSNEISKADIVIAKLPDTPTDTDDVDGDGQVTSNDVVVLLQRDNIPAALELLQKLVGLGA